MKKINKFINEYNDLIDTVNELTDYNTETKTAGVLFGNATVRIAENQIRHYLVEKISGTTGNIQTLADLGITTNTSGKLAVNNTILDNALANNFDDIGRIFAASGKPTDSLIEYVGAGTATQDGNYAVNITTLATQGDLVASTAANLTITEDVNDTISFEIDNVSATITLAAGTYTAATWRRKCNLELMGPVLLVHKALLLVLRNPLAC